MAAGTVAVRGLRELQRDTRRLSGSLSSETREGLKEAAEPVRREAQALFARIDAHSAAGYGVAVRARGVAVQQRRRRVTGRRGDYGALQMRRALLPALERRTTEVIRGLERMLDRLAGANGW